MIDERCEIRHAIIVRTMRKYLLLIKFSHVTKMTGRDTGSGQLQE